MANSILALLKDDPTGESAVNALNRKDPNEEFGPELLETAKRGLEHLEQGLEAVKSNFFSLNLLMKTGKRPAQDQNPESSNKRQKLIPNPEPNPSVESTKPAAQPEPKSTPKPTTPKPTSKPVVELELEPEPERAAEPESEPVIELESEPVIEPEPEPEPERAAEPEPKPAVNPAPKPEPEPKPKPGWKIKPFEIEKALDTNLVCSKAGCNKKASRSGRCIGYNCNKALCKECEDDKQWYQCPECLKSCTVGSIYLNTNPPQFGIYGFKPNDCKDKVAWYYMRDAENKSCKFGKEKGDSSKSRDLQRKCYYTTYVCDSEVQGRKYRADPKYSTSLETAKERRDGKVHPQIDRLVDEKRSAYVIPKNLKIEELLFQKDVPKLGVGSYVELVYSEPPKKQKKPAKQ